MLIAFMSQNAAAIPVGGRAFDEIRVSGLPSADLPSLWYRFSLADGQQSSIAVSGENEGGLAIYDSEQRLLVRSEANATRLHDFVDTTTDGRDDDYFIRVIGPKSDSIQLGVTRDLTVDGALSVTNARLAYGPTSSVFTLDAGDPPPTVEAQHLSAISPSLPPSLTVASTGQSIPFGTPTTLTELSAGSHQILGPANGTFHYLYNIDGIEHATTFNIQTSIPRDQARLRQLPPMATLDLGLIRRDTVEPSDFLINGQPAENLTFPSATEVQFAIPDLGVKDYSITIPAGSITNISGLPIAEASTSFSLDTESPRITGVNLATGNTLPLGEFELVVDFDEPVSTTSRGILLSDSLGNQMRYSMIIDDTTNTGRAQISIDGEGIYTLTVVGNNIRDQLGNRLDGESNVSFPSGDGNPGGDYQVTFFVDEDDADGSNLMHSHPISTGAYFAETITRTITPNDTDSIRVSLSGGQRVQIQLRADDDLRPLAAWVTPDGTTVDVTLANQAGTSISEILTATTEGEYVIQIAGQDATIGSVEVDVFVNAQFENETIIGAANDVADAAERLYFVESGSAGVARANVDGSLVNNRALGLHNVVDFETGVLDNAWTTSTLGTGSVTVGIPDLPGQENNGLVMTGGANRLNQAAFGSPLADTVIVYYDATTGEISFESARQLTSLEIKSSSGVLTGSAAENLEEQVHTFNVDTDQKLFKLETLGFHNLSFGNVAAVGLADEFLQSDLQIDGSFLGGGQINPALVVVSNGSLNEAVWTIQLDAGNVLAFDQWSSSNETISPIPALYSGSMPGDGISISQDGQTWHALNIISSHPADTWASQTLPIAEIAADLSLDLGRPLQLKFQQFGDSGSIAWDNLNIGSFQDEDWYQISLRDGQSVSAMLTTGNQDDATRHRLELFDSSRKLVAVGSVTGVAESQLVTRITGVVDTTTDGAENDYFVRVQGHPSEYRLTVTTDAFNVSDSQDIATDLSQLGTAYGWISAHPTTLDSVEPNDSISTAQSINSGFRLESGMNVTDSDRFPHATVIGTGNGTLDFYSFEVQEAGSRAIFDIDETVNLDSYLQLFNSDGVQLRSSDDANADPGSSTALDSFIRHTFSAAGTYYVAVGSCCVRTVAEGSTYVLHVTLEDATNGGDGDLQFDVRATAGDALAIDFAAVNPLQNPDGYPDVSLVSPSGEIVSTAVGAALVTLEHTATETGRYRAVLDSAAVDGSDFLISMSGSSVSADPAHVTNASLVDGAFLSKPPLVVTLKFSEGIRVDTLDLDDFVIDGLPAVGFRAISADTINVSLPPLTEKAYQLQLLPQSITDLAGNPVEPFDLGFTVDSTRSRIVSSSLEQNSKLGTDRVTVQLQFDESIDPASLSDASVRLIGNFGAIVPDAMTLNSETNLLSLEFSRLLDDNYNLWLSDHGTGTERHITDLAGNSLDGFPSHPLPSGSGLGGRPFRIPFSVDLGTVPYDGPYLPLTPLFGDLAYRTESRTYAISGEDDVDTRTYNLQAGQTMVAQVTQVDPGTQYSARILDPQGGTIATLTDGDEPGTVISDRITIETAGNYTFEVSGAGETAGRVSLDLLLNVAYESERVSGQTNGTQETAEDLDRRQASLGNVNVLATVDAEATSNWFTFTVNDGQKFSVSIVGSGAALHLYGPDSQRLASTGPSESGSHTINGVVGRTPDGQPGQYWVQVDGAASSEFRLSLRRDGVFARDPADRAVLGLPQRLNNGEPVLGQLSIDVADRFTLTAVTGDTLTVDLNSVWAPEGAPHATSSTPVVRLLDTEGTELSQQVADEAGSLTLTHIATADGDIIVEVSRSDADSQSEYVLTASGSSAALGPRVVEINPADGATIIYPLAVGVTFDSQIDLSSVRPESVIVGGVPARGFTEVDSHTLSFELNREAAQAFEGNMFAIEVGVGTVRDLAGHDSAAFTSSFRSRAVRSDLDDNGLLDSADLDTFCQIFRGDAEDRVLLDINGDGDVTLDDFFVLATDHVGTRLGDANSDGVYDALDLVQIFSAGIYETNSDASWAHGDVNCDGRFNTADFVLTWQFGRWDEAPAARAVDQIADVVEPAVSTADYLDLIAAAVLDSLDRETPNGRRG